MGLFKNKKGQPSLFSKIVKGAGKVVSVAAPMIPVPGAGKIGSIIGKISSKIKTKSGGAISLSGLAPKSDDTLKSYVERVEQGVGGAVAGLDEETKKNYNPNNALGLDPLSKGAANQVTKKYLLWGAAAVGAVVLAKALKIF